MSPNSETLKERMRKIANAEYQFVQEAIGKIDSGNVGPKEIGIYELMSSCIFVEGIEKQAENARLEANTAEKQSIKALSLAKAMNWLTGALVLVGLADFILRLFFK